MKSQSNWDNKLKEALQLYQQRQMTLIPSDEQINIVPSKRFETNMQKLISRQRKPYFYLINTAGKRAAVIIAVMFITLTTTVFSVEALRKPVVEFFVTVFEKFSTVIFGTGTEQDIADASSKDDFYIPAFTYSGTSSKFESTVSRQDISSDRNSSLPGSITTSSKSTANSSHTTSGTVTSHEPAVSSPPHESSRPTVDPVPSSSSSVLSVSSAQKPEPGFPAEILEIHLPKIPDGYELDFEEKNRTNYYTEYVNENDISFSFEQYVITTTKLTVDTEATVIKQTEINSYTALYFEDKGCGNLLWTDGEYGYNLIGIPDQAFLIKLAESVK